MKYFILGLSFAFGWALAMYTHPYERCLRKGYTQADHIGECIWLLENQPSLR